MISLQKKIWSNEEDEVLKKLYEDEGMRNWSMIAKRMTLDHSLPRKSAKQCRERYENHISMETTKVEWTIEQELMLIQYHNQIGNKWSVIAQRIPGKSDNCIKNHFYSKLRKVLRKLNAVIHAYFRREFRQININVIYKIVEACQEQFKENPGCEQSVSSSCRQIQNKMLNLSMLQQELFDSQERVAIYREVVKEIYGVSKLYKRKSKKSRNSSIQAPTIKAGKKKKQVIVLSAGNPEQGYSSDPSSVFEDGESFESCARKQKVDKDQQFESEQYQVKVKPPKKKNEIVVKDEEHGIKEMLKDAGLLQFDHSDAISVNGLKVSSRSSFKSYSQKVPDSDQAQNDPFYFGDSQVQPNFISKKRKRSYFKNLDDPSQKSQKQGPGEI